MFVRTYICYKYYVCYQPALVFTVIVKDVESFFNRKKFFHCVISLAKDCLTDCCTCSKMSISIYSTVSSFINPIMICFIEGFLQLSMSSHSSVSSSSFYLCLSDIFFCWRQFSILLKSGLSSHCCCCYSLNV